MDLLLGWHLSIEDRPSPAARNRLGRELGKHNRPYLRNAKWQWLGVFVREPDGDIAAGLAGSTYGDWMFVHDLWVRADLRRRGIGQELLHLAEALRASAAATPLGWTRFRSRRRNFIRNSVTASSAGSIIRPTSSEFSFRSG